MAKTWPHPALARRKNALDSAHTFDNSAGYRVPSRLEWTMRLPLASYLRTPLGRAAVCAGALLVFGTTSIKAQFDNGQIAGFVRDASGAVVPGVVVTATNEGT